ncbi:hypothetical protein Tco_1078890 [Tanacetum coccineum]|uniref:Integrase, catalytic region, zinc finger, CCHC-type, peptidase aspartic, catalytic n=1 Tax=Tanacetum coccineum TaxID=301880 RepID=A0ABQ5HRX8_9ASTR
MTTLAEYMILSGVDNCPPMLDKDLYDSWKSRMELYMQYIEHGRMILESVEHGPLIWPTIEENGVTRTKKYVELSATEKLQADCDMKAINIILQGLPTEIYSLVNHHRVAKDLWEKVQLLMQGTSLTKQERECKLYDAFDKFAHIKGESLHQYYLRFTQQINDMNIYNMKLEQFQVNTKFLNSLPPEWSKFVTDVKLVKDLHTTNFDQLYAYLEQYEPHVNEARLMCERNQDPLGICFVVPVFSPRDDPIACLNKAMAFLTAVASSRGDKVKIILKLVIRVMLLNLGETMQVDRQGLLNATTVKVKDIWLGNALSLSDQTEDLDTYDSDCNDISNGKVVLMANISNYGSDVISEIEQAFWLRMSNPTSKPSDASPVKIEAPKELLKVSLVNESLKKLKFHLARFDNVVKIRTTPDAHTKDEWGFEHTKAVFNNEIMPFLKSLKEIINVIDRDLLNEIIEVQIVFNQMDVIVQQSSVDKQCLEIAKKELLLEND